MYQEALSSLRLEEAQPESDPASKTSLIPIASVISAAFASSVLVAPLYPLYQKKFDFSEVFLTLIYAAYVVGNVVALLFLGQVSDRMGRKRVSLPALGIVAVGALVFLFATSIAWLFAGRLVLGLAVGILSGTGTAWLAERTDRQRATVIATIANLFGIAVGPVLGGVLAEYGPRPLQLPFIAYLAALAGVALVAARIPEPSAAHIDSIRDLRFQPRVGVPRDRLGAFAAPAVTGFVIFSLGGLYFALDSDGLDPRSPPGKCRCGRCRGSRGRRGGDRRHRSDRSGRPGQGDESRPLVPIARSRARGSGAGSPINAHSSRSHGVCGCGPRPRIRRESSGGQRSCTSRASSSRCFELLSLLLCRQLCTGNRCRSALDSDDGRDRERHTRVHRWRTFTGDPRLVFPQSLDHTEAVTKALRSAITASWSASSAAGMTRSICMKPWIIPS